MTVFLNTSNLVNRILISTVLFFSAWTLVAGDISGVVLDTETGQILKAANLKIINTNLGTASDESGKFEFSNIPENQVDIQCAYMGYQDNTVSVTLNQEETTQIRIEMTPTILALPNITVESMKAEQDIRDIPMPVSIVSERRIKTSAPVSVSDVLTEEPGLSLRKDGAWATDINIRGLSGQKIVTLVDGHRIETASNIAAGLSMIDVNDIDRIEVIKGAASVLYGSGAMGGVVNIITKQNQFVNDLTWHASLLSGYNSADNRGTGRVSANLASQKWYLTLSTSMRKAENVKTPEGVLENSHFSDNNLSASLGFKFSDAHQMGFQYQKYHAEDVGIPGGAPFPAPAVARYPEEERTLTSLSYQYTPGDDHFKKLSLRVFQQNIWRDVELTLPTAIVNPNAEHNTRGIQLQTNWLFGNHQLITGIDGWQRDLNSNRTKHILAVNKIVGEKPIPTASYRSIGFFVQDNVNLTSSLKATLGGRIDQIQTENDPAWQPEYIIQNDIRTDKPGNNQLWDANKSDDISYSGNLGLIWLLNPDVEATLNLARAFRSPTLEERYQYIELGAATFWGNPDLNPEIGNFVDAGIRFWKPNWTFKANVFYNQLTDLVVDQWESEGVYRMANVGKARLYGFDAGTEINVWKNWTVFGSVAYVRGEDLELDENLPQIPPMSGRTGIRFWIGSLLKVNASATFASKQDKVAESELETDGYTRLDAFVSTKTMHLGKLKGRLILGVDNITDEAYRLHLSTYRGLIRLEPGRSFRATWMMDI